MGTRSLGPTVVSLIAVGVDENDLVKSAGRMTRRSRQTLGSLVGIELATVLLSRLDMAEFLQRRARQFSAHRQVFGFEDVTKGHNATLLTRMQG